MGNSIESEARKKAVSLTVISPKSYGLLQNLLAPTKPADTDYAALINTMKDHLSPKPLIIAEQYKFCKRTQHEGESVAQYLAALRKLVEKCDFRDFLNQALCDKLVCGLQNENKQRKSLAEADLMLQYAFKVAQGMETAQYQAIEWQASSVSHNVHALSATKQACFHCGKQTTPLKNVTLEHRPATNVRKLAT